MTELAYDERGEGPVLVLLHGITENGHSWDPLVPALSRDHRVVVPDLRGHGRSPQADGYALADLAEDLHPLAGDDALVVGHSLGGMVATAYAAAHPVRGVVNVDQSLDLGGMQAQVQEAAPALRSEAFPGVIHALFESMRGATPANEWERLTALRRPDQDVVLGVWSLLLDTTPEELADVVEQLCAPVRAPYLALNGIDAGQEYEKWLQQRIPQARVETWPEVGHYPHLTRSAEFLERLRDFEGSLAT